MMNQTIQVTHWDDETPPSESDLLQRFAAEHLQPYRWGNAPGDVYPAHTHRYHKVIYVVSGSITFGLPEKYGGNITLTAGDRLDLPPGMIHDALVGPEGVICLEAHRDS
jgi:quercetin dioxygenase-like cupin family protein